jgi:23S rRNA Um-2552 2''-O-methyltransferase (EC 2.1.1.-)
MSNKDRYYNQAKQEGYRARSAYKLKQLDETAGLFSPGDTVIDLGAAPGSWLQVAGERVGTAGRVVGVDRQRIEDPEVSARVETIQGDVTDAETITAIRRGLGADTTDDGDERRGDRPVDAVVSDLAPNMTGTYDLDHARSVHLARQVLAIAEDLLAAGGDMAVKVFQGGDLEEFRGEVDAAFEYARTVEPDASRDASSEVYVVGKGRLTAPVRPGDRAEVDIIDEGSEGDGVAKVEGFTLFVPGGEAGETVFVEVTDLKPNFGFAERVDDGVKKS